MRVDDQLVEDRRLLAGETVQTQVLDDEQVGRRVRSECPLQ